MNINKRVSHTNERPFFRKTIRSLVLIIFIVAFYQVGVRYAEPRLLPIKHIQMDEKFERIDVLLLKEQIKPKIKGFFSTNVMALKKQLQSVPFVDEVFIKRVWPDTLLVTLTELTLVASWGEDAAVSSHGDIIKVKIDPDKHLPNFVGSADQVLTMLDQFKELSVMLRPFNLAISEISLNPRHSWRVNLDNGMKIFLGRKDLAEHLKSFVAIYPKLKKLHGNNIESIDLRHSNGVSIQLVRPVNE